jgi:hypothetical protein
MSGIYTVSVYGVLFYDVNLYEHYYSKSSSDKQYRIQNTETAIKFRDNKYVAKLPRKQYYGHLIYVCGITNKLYTLCCVYLYSVFCIVYLYSVFCIVWCTVL